jgi:DUF971 family protein
MNWHAHPVEIRYQQEDDQLYIKFSDGVEHTYETKYLRGYCPSAVYQRHGSRPLKWTEPKNQQQITIEDISQVGNYAICIAWADGHNKGVYSFQMLRRFAEEPEGLLEDFPPDQ